MHRKGFIQIVEVIIAAIFIAMALPVFFNVNAKLNWERPDLIEAGNSILSAIYYSGNITDVFENPSNFVKNLEYTLPPNTKYAVYIEGSPKPLIRVGCICNDSELSFVRGALAPVYFNNYWIKFDIDKFDFSYTNATDYDMLLFINYTSFEENETDILNYLDAGKGIVAVNPGYAGSSFYKIFNLTTSTSPTADAAYFTGYKPWNNKIEKYFIGFGFDIPTPTPLDGKQQGVWKMWGWSKEINSTGTQVEIENVGVFSENENFTLTQPSNGLDYMFKIKKIWPDKSGVIIQPLNTSFAFNNFVESTEQKVKGTNIVSSGPAAVAANGTAVWISDFPEGDEYNTLLKASIASVTDKFYAVTPRNVKESARVVKFFNMCCDTPETVKIVLTLWYFL